MGEPQERYSRHIAVPIAPERNPMERLVMARRNLAAPPPSKSLARATATNVLTEHLEHAFDESPTKLPASAWQRFVGTGVASDPEKVRRESRARRITIMLTVLACVIMILSAILIFNPLARRPSFGLATNHIVQTVTTTATVIAILPPPTAVPTLPPTIAPPAMPTATHVAAPSGPPVATTAPAPRATPTHVPTVTPIAVPTPTFTPTATATATATPLPTDDATLVSQSSAQTVTQDATFPIQFQVKNSGNTTWDAASDYALTCVANCFTAGDNKPGTTVAPGATYSFGLTLQAPGNYQPQVGTQWQLRHGGNRFGPLLTVAVSVQGWDTLTATGAPYCNNPAGINWAVGFPASTHATCNGSGHLSLQQVFPTSGPAHFAELDMQQNGGDYDQTHFEVQVDTAFINPYIAGTRACLISQISNAFNQKIICIDQSGGWVLQYVTSNGAVHDISQYSGNIGSGTHTLKMAAQNGQLTMSVGSTTFTLANPGPTTGEVGVLTENGTNDPSSQVDFSNFTMKVWRG